MKQDNAMKHTREQLESEVTRTMEILEQMPRLRVHHLFRARLLHKIAEAGEDNLSGRAAGGMFNARLVFMTLLIVVNITSALFFYRHDVQSGFAEKSTDLQEAFSEEYASPALSYYVSSE